MGLQTQIGRSHFRARHFRLWRRSFGRFGEPCSLKADQIASTVFVWFLLFPILSYGANIENRIATEVQMHALATPDPQGLSHNDLTIKLKDNGLPKIVYLDLQFDAGLFKSMNVKLPSISAEGCKELPEIAKWLPAKNSPAPLEMYHRTNGWSPDQSEPWIDCIYDIDQEIGTSGGHQTVTLRFSTAKACAKLHVQVDVQFKGAGG
jgi:hypothetical protein